MGGRISGRQLSPGHFFVLDVGRTDADSVRIHFRPAPPLRSFQGYRRKLAIAIYTLAAELERRSEEVDAQWVTAPQPWDERLDVEVAVDGDSDVAEEFVRAVLADLGLM